MSAAITTEAGTLNLASRAAQCAAPRRLVERVAVAQDQIGAADLAPARVGDADHRGLGDLGISASAASTSAGKTFSPPDMYMSLRRSTT